MSRRFFKGKRRRPAGSVAHLEGHLFNRGGAFQATPKSTTRVSYLPSAKRLFIRDPRSTIHDPPLLSHSCSFAVQTLLTLSSITHHKSPISNDPFFFATLATWHGRSEAKAKRSLPMKSRPLQFLPHSKFKIYHSAFPFTMCTSIGVSVLRCISRWGNGTPMPASVKCFSIISRRSLAITDELAPALMSIQ